MPTPTPPFLRGSSRTLDYLVGEFAPPNNDDVTEVTARWLEENAPTIEWDQPVSPHRGYQMPQNYQGPTIQNQEGVLPFFPTSNTPIHVSKPRENLFGYGLWPDDP